MAKITWSTMGLIRECGMPIPAALVRMVEPVSEPVHEGLKIRVCGPTFVTLSAPVKRMVTLACGR